MSPLLLPALRLGFVDLLLDPAELTDRWGYIEARPTALEPNSTLRRPALNYSAGATIFAAFDQPDGSFDVFSAVGRPGEPIGAAPPGRPGGVSVLRHTTTDFQSYSKPELVLFHLQQVLLLLLWRRAFPQQLA